ncbi:MAG: 3'(2'),5'-bisphosphate nucleotidase CysQ [Alphaproteobacteria bacterium]
MQWRIEATHAAVLRDLVPPLVGLAEQAGRVILAVYARGDGLVAAKGDSSPVTTADHAADAILQDGLRFLTPDWPVVSEERAASHLPDFDRPVWLVDPLDGTREFLDRNGEFAVSIGLIVAGHPVLGVVHGPAVGLSAWGIVGPGRDRGAWRRDGSGPIRSIACRPRPAAGAVAAVSRRHGRDAALDAFLAAESVGETRACGSALKFCLVASGEADLYPRFGTTCEWDTAGGHAIVAAAGGDVTLVDGRALTYGKPGLRNPDFIARGLSTGQADGETRAGSG